MDRFESRFRIWTFAVCGTALVAWLWPIGFGGRMPVGGDATRFSIGLMSELGRALRAGRLPLWNDLWGFGFPGLAESQMGVYYPPHLLLYGLFPLETAYTVSLVFHTIWGAAGAYWASRRFGASSTGATLAGFCWTASGFFLIHLPHQWGYTVGSWMPWAWGLAWPLANGTGSPRDVLRLAAVLTLQILPGHFQLAFITQAGVIGLGLWVLGERLLGPRLQIRGVLGLYGAVIAILALGACQLVPTWRLARLAETRRDFEYLSGFAASPIHLVSYLAPGLFHRSSLWRPVAWDPFHTSPEEQMAYIGLVPLFLALGAMRRGWRTDRATRALTCLALGTLLLSLGPYLPGFGYLIKLPGFSFFRAPARWGLATELALAMLAAKGFDRLGTWVRPGWSLARFAIVAAVLAALPVLLFELTLASSSPSARPVIAPVLNAGLAALPWKDGLTSDQITGRAHQAPQDTLVLTGLVREGEDPAHARLDRDRLRIYRRELTATALILVGMLVLAPLARFLPLLLLGVVGLTVTDLLVLGQSRPVDTAPIMPLTTLSPVLGTLAKEPHETRIVADLGNLPLAANVATIEAYRTLDRPALVTLTRMASAIPRNSVESLAYRQVLKTLGVAIRVGEDSLPRPLMSLPGRLDRVFDPWLTTLAQQPLPAHGSISGQYTLWHPAGLDGCRAWFLPTPRGLEFSEVAAITDPSQVLRMMAGATPLRWRQPVPERMNIELDAPGPGMIVVTRLDDPEWRGTLRGPDGREHDVPVRRLFAAGGTEHGGWQGIPVPGPGRWTIEIIYRGQAAYTGLALSAVAWAAWFLAYWSSRPRPVRNVAPADQASLSSSAEMKEPQ